MKKRRNGISNVTAIVKESIDSLAYRRKLKERMKKEMKPWQTVTGWKGKLQMEKCGWPMLPIPNNSYASSNLHLPLKQSTLNNDWLKLAMKEWKKLLILNKALSGQGKTVRNLAVVKSACPPVNIFIWISKAGIQQKIYLSGK